MEDNRTSNHRKGFGRLLHVVSLFLLGLNSAAASSGSKSESASGSAAKPLFFVHIPKTGGSFVENLFHDAHIGVGKYWEWSSLLADLEPPCSPWHVPPKFHRDLDFRNYTVFTVVRDPGERTVSQAAWELSAYHEKKSMAQKLQEMRSTMARRHGFGHDYLQYTFDRDCHYLPQVEYLYDSRGHVVENILRTEFLYEDLMAFVERYRLDDVRHGLEEAGEQHTRTGNSFTVEKYVGSSEMEEIREYYKADYRFFQEHGTSFS
eukprot:scaffold1395_cov244-Pinguiococcus_pyrenoidosus.AAC.7